MFPIGELVNHIGARYIDRMAKGETVKELRAWRERQGLTLEQAADRLGRLIDHPVTRSMFYSWESGDKLPGQAFMVGLVALCGGELLVEDFYPEAARLARAERIREAAPMPQAELL